MQGTKEISILGLTQSGKSTYLAVLKNALEKKKSSWMLEPNDEETIIAMGKFRQRMFAKRLYPLKTDDPEKLEFRVYGGTYWGINPGGEFILQAYDVPGDAIKGLETSLYANFYQKYVSNSSAIIFLLDPESSWMTKDSSEDSPSGDVYYPLFSSIIDQIKLYRKGQVYMAFCVTKLDTKLPPNSEFDKTGKFKGTKEIAREILGPNTIDAIDFAFDKEHLAWFPVSATGYTGTGQTRTSQYQIDEDGQVPMIKDPRSLGPINVARSFEWAINAIAELEDDAITSKERGPNFAKMQKTVRHILRRFE